MYEAQKRYYQKNKEIIKKKIAGYNKARYKRNPEIFKEYVNKWRKKNKEKYNEQARIYYWKNVDKLRPKIAARQRKYNKTPKSKVLSDNPTAVYQRLQRIIFKQKYGISWNQVYRYGKNALVAVERANKKCERCNSSESLDIHHIDGNGRSKIDKGYEANNNLNNLMVLCRSCHYEIHRELARREGDYNDKRMHPSNN